MDRGKTASRLLFEESKAFFAKYPNDMTRQAYIKNYRKYIYFCREQFKCKSKDDCAAHIADYAAHLQKQGYTASTIHTYLAPVAIYHGINLAELDKPKCKTAAYTRGRSLSGKTPRSDNNFLNKQYAHTVAFQRRVGIRRAELARLKGSDLVRDESGHLCVRVRRGKGGKMQLQRILPGDIAFIQRYFACKAPNEPIFSKAELRNKLAYHYLRAMQAQRAYQYYVKRVRTKAGRAKLEEEIRRRWNKYNLNPRTGKPKRLDPKLLRGFYFLRGDNKQFAITHGLPTEYDRLALLAVSIFHLSHWRNDVTAESYMLVV